MKERLGNIGRRARELRAHIEYHDPEYRYRYLSLTEAITTHAAELPNPAILEIGSIAHPQGTLADFLPPNMREHVKSLNKDINQLPVRDTGVNVTADARRLPFADDSIGCVAHTDTLEHVAKDDREAFFNETVRVLAPGGLMVIAFPTGLPAERAEDWLNKRYKNIHGTFHPFLEEHKEFGLPDKVDMEFMMMSHPALTDVAPHPGINVSAWMRSHQMYTLGYGGFAQKFTTHLSYRRQAKAGTLNAEPSYRTLITARKRTLNDTI